MDAHPDCKACSLRECLTRTKKIAEPQICRYGITFARIDDNRVVNGVLAKDLAGMPSRASKRQKMESDRRVTSKQLVSAIQRVNELGPGVVNAFESETKLALKRLEMDPKIHRAVSEILLKDFDKSFERSHDFLQLVRLVQEHAEALLSERSPGLSPEDAADNSKIEGSIYYSTKLMALKINSWKFLGDGYLARRNIAKFQIHPLVLQYVRVYNWKARQREIIIRVRGDSYSFSEYNNEAIGAVVHAILDNLVKYAPPGSHAEILFLEKDFQTEISFTSLGPRIEPEEIGRIFLPGIRAEASKVAESSGQGIGLATAKIISDTLDLQLGVNQNPVVDAKYSDRYSTTFSFHLKTQKLPH